MLLLPQLVKHATLLGRETYPDRWRCLAAWEKLLHRPPHELRGAHKAPSYYKERQRRRQQDGGAVIVLKNDMHRAASLIRGVPYV